MTTDVTNPHYDHPIAFEFDTKNCHRAKIVCRRCSGAYIKWASNEEIAYYKNSPTRASDTRSLRHFRYMENKELWDSIYDEYKNRHVACDDNNFNVYLTVDYTHRATVKKLGARWDNQQRRWFIKSNWSDEKILKFAEWIDVDTIP